MMKKILGISLVLPTLLFGESYADYLKAQRDAFERDVSETDRDFDQHKKDLEADFNNYKAILEKELNDYKKEVSAIWGDSEISTKDKWVEYSEDKKKRKIVDFESGEIVIEIISKESPKSVEKELYREALKTITETPQVADKNDELTKRVEEKFEKVAKTEVEKKPVSDEVPILASVMFAVNKTISDIVKFVSSEKTKTEVKPSKVENEKVYSTKIALPKDFPLKKALQYKDDVEKYSKVYKIESALVYAIMHSESSFNPMAKSYVPAYGLMQIVPKTAGADSYEMVYSKKRILPASYLYNSRNNIELGSAYLNILYYRYLKYIENPKSRFYCAIAGYNTGAGNVARSFIGNNSVKKASVVINKMTPEEVYAHLEKNLPYDETKRYIKKVTTRYEAYKKAGM
jgi:membrane-bound lytic murein transglycosylase C